MLYPVPVRRAWPPSVRPVPLRHPQADKPHPQGKAMPAGTQRERLADLAGPAALAHRQVQRPPLPRRPGNAAAAIRSLPLPPHATVNGPNAALNALRATTMRVPSEAHAIAHRIPPISEATDPDSQRTRAPSRTRASPEAPGYFPPLEWPAHARQSPNVSLASAARRQKAVSKSGAPPHAVPPIVK